jgi:tRNA threonylcarbamoyl adenosine modification protein (Sua5/YciO/YrdC/YwlC family)
VSDPIDEAVAAVQAGGLVVLPTDTVYGLGTKPDDPQAVRRIFEAKGRSRDLELPVLVPSVEAAGTIVVLDARARALADRFWPGPLTLILRRTAMSAGWDLGGDAGTLGVRMPRHALAQAVLERTGPLAMTSANRSGEPPATTCEELHRIFGDRVEVFLCEERARAGVASTVADLTGGAIRVLRLGAISPAELGAALEP